MPFRILRFVETVDGATYTARTSIPKGARLMDVMYDTSTAWTAATAPLKVGDSGGDDTLVEAQDIAAANGSADACGNAGSAWDATSGTYAAGGSGILYPNGDVVTAVIEPTVPGGPTGVSAVMLWFEPAGAGQAATAVAAP